MGRSYNGKICKKCGGMHTEIKDDGQPEPEEPITFHHNLPKSCECEE